MRAPLQDDAQKLSREDRRIRVERDTTAKIAVRETMASISLEREEGRRKPGAQVDVSTHSQTALRPLTPSLE